MDPLKSQITYSEMLTYAKMNSTKRRNGLSAVESDVRTLNPAVEVDKKSSISIFP